jgi:YVTN family beta-propeller protein/probable HAF family extracellular repeat protein
MSAKRVFAVVLGLCLAGAVNAAAQSYTFHKVQYPGAVSTTITAVNEAGVAVGYATLPNSNASLGFVFNRGTFTPFVPFGSSSVLSGINRAGVAYGWANTPNTQQHAVVFKDGVRYLLTPGGFISSIVVKMNEAGHLLGNASDGSRSFAFVATPSASGYDVRVLRFPQSTHTTGIDLNQRGQVIGNSSAGGEWRAFVYTPGDAGPRDLGTLGGSYAWAQDINERGDITGHSREASSSNQAFLLLDGESAMTPIALAGYSTYGERINEQRQLYVRGHDGAVNHGYIYSAGDGSLRTVAPPGSYSSSIAVLSDDGRVYGSYAYSFVWKTRFYSCGLFNQQTCSEQYKSYSNRAFSYFDGVASQLSMGGDSSLVAGHGAGVAAIQTNGADLFVSKIPGQLTYVPRIGAQTIETGWSSINSQGVLVGTLRSASGSPRAFRYDAGQTTDLTALAGVAGATLYNAAHITDSGHVAGTATFDGVSGAFLMLLETDGDGDGWLDRDDNCPQIANADQLDWDQNGIGNACDVNALPHGVIDHDPAHAGIPAVFSGSGSSDADGSLVSFEWDFNYDGGSFDSMATGQVVPHTYPSTGSFVVALRLTDNRGGVSVASQNVVVTEGTPPTVSITSPLEGGVYALGQLVQPKYSCADNVAVASCVASSAVFTTTAGEHEFSVTATDTAGNVTTRMVSYLVRAGVERQWQPAAPLPTAQYFGNAIAMADGAVLVAGGQAAGDVPIPKAASYDSKTNVWSPTPNMSGARSDSAAVTLADGRILITGGNQGSGRTGGAEIFDPATRQWTVAAPMNSPRNRHTLTLLSDGKVLATGGYLTHSDPYQQYQRTAEVYDPVLDKWTAVADMAERRVGHSASRLPDGRVLIVGGADYAEYKATVEIFNPATGTFSSGPSLSERRYFHSVATLPDGRILIAGGMNFFKQFNDALAYNPVTGQWQAAGVMSKPRVYFSMTLMADGRVLAAGGYSGTAIIAATDVFDPNANSWQPAANMASARYLASIAPLKDGGVIVAGGWGPAPMALAEVWNGARAIPALTIPRVSAVSGQPAQVVVTTTGPRPVTLAVGGRLYGPLVPSAAGQAVFTNVDTTGLPFGLSQSLMAMSEADDVTAEARGVGEIEIVGTVTTLTVPAVSAGQGDAAILVAVLSSAAGPLVGQTVSFDLRSDGTYDAAGVTDANGKAAVTFSPAQLAPLGVGVGPHPVKVVFSGSAGYLPSSGAGTLTIVDTIPPTATITSPLAGAVYRLGEAVSFHFTCSDNTAAITQCQTSAGAASGGSLDTSTPGVRTLTVQVRDGAGNTASRSISYTVVDVTALAPAEVWVTHDNKISILDSLTNQLKFQIPSLSRPFVVQFSRDGKRAYVGDNGSNHVLAFDVATRAEIGRVQVGRNPAYLATSTDGNLIFVANTNDGTVTVVDAATLSVLRTVAVGSLPFGMAVIPESGEVFVALAGDGAIAVLDKMGAQVVSRIAVGNNPHTLAVLASGRRAYVAVQSPGTVIEIDTREHSVLRELFVGTNSVSTALSPDGRELYVINSSPNGRIRTVDLASWSVVADLGAGYYPSSPARAANAPRLFVPGSANGELWVVDTVANAVVHTLDLGDRTFAAAVTPLAVTLAVPAALTVAAGAEASYTVAMNGPTGPVAEQHFRVTAAGFGTLVSWGRTALTPVAVPFVLSSPGILQATASFFGNEHYVATSADTTLTVTDGTPPVITPVVVGTRHASGWYTSDVVVTWSVSDPESAVSLSPGCGTTSVGAELPGGTTLTCTATSAGGSASLSITILKDGTPPDIVSAIDGATFERGAIVTADFGCTDTISVASCTAPIAVHSALDTSTVGEFSFVVTAIDAVGHRRERTITYFVAPATTAFYWSPVPSSSPQPSARFGHGMVYDRVRQKVILIGGRGPDGTYFNDVWERDSATGDWTEIAPATEARPLPRHTFGIAFDEDRRVVLIYAGRVSSAYSNVNSQGDSWEWNPQTREWRQVSADPIVTAGFIEASLAWDPVGRRVIMFGGRPYYGTPHSADTYAWGANGWVKIASQGPEARAAAAMSTDTRRNRVVLHGGWNRSGGTWWLLNDTWEWDGTQWLRMDVPGSGAPQGRSQPAMVFDEARGVTVLFGGNLNGPHLSALRNETYEWNGREWRHRSTTGTPSPRLTTMVYDPVARRILLFGGNNSASDGRNHQLPNGAFGDTFLGAGYETIPTSLAAEAAAVAIGGTTALRATLTGPMGPLANRTIQFDLNSDGVFEGHAMTNATGVATASMPWSVLMAAGINSAGTVPFSAVHEADGQYGSAQSASTLEISRVSTAIAVAERSVVFDGTPQTVPVGVVTTDGTVVVDAATIVTYNGSSEPPVNAGSHAVLVEFAGDAIHAPASASTTLTITRATPRLTAAEGRFVYDGTAHPAVVTLLGVLDEPLDGAVTIYSPGGDAPINAGIYQADVSFSGNDNYEPATATATIHIDRAHAQLIFRGGLSDYDAMPHPASGSAVGVSGEELGALRLGYRLVSSETPGKAPAAGGEGGEAAPATEIPVADKKALDGKSPAEKAPETKTPADADFIDDEPIDAGVYEVKATFDGSDNYEPLSIVGKLVILPVKPTIVVTGGAYVYDGLVHSAAGSATGVGGQSVGELEFVYSPDVTVPIDAGVYGVTGSFGGSRNYLSAQASAEIVIGKAPATITLTGGTFNYDGTPHGATVAVTGIDGVDLAEPGSVTVAYAGSADAPTHAGTYEVAASFGGNANYAESRASASLVIAPVPLTASVLDSTRTYGQPNGSFAVTFLGFVGADSQAGLAGALAFTTLATPASPTGSYPVTAAGLSSTDYVIGFVPGVVTVVAAPSVVTLSSSSNPAGYQQSITLRADVAPSPAGGGVATGTVDFVLGNGTVLGSSPIIAGVAVLNVVVAPGSHTITARYSGDGNVRPGAATMTQSVNDRQDSSTIQLSVRPSPSRLGEVVVMEARVSATGEATGVVVFQNGQTPLGAATLVSGRAIFETSNLPAGTYMLSARYNGSSTIPGSSSAPVIHNVLDGSPKAKTTTRISSRNVKAGTPIVVDIKVDSPSGTPTGYVDLVVDGQYRGAAGLRTDGTASVTLGPMATGDHSISVLYKGSATHLGSGSDAVLRVGK